MKQKLNKMDILISLLAISLIGVLIFWLLFVNVNIARLISSNPITLIVLFLYWKPPTYLIIIPIAFANVVCAVKGLRSIYKEKASTSKRIIGYWIYTIISLGAVVIHCITFVFVIGGVIAG